MRLERAYGMGTETENLPGYQVRRKAPGFTGNCI